MAFNYMSTKYYEFLCNIKRNIPIKKTNIENLNCWILGCCTSLLYLPDLHHLYHDIELCIGYIFIYITHLNA